MFWTKPDGKGPWPVLILVHEHQPGDRPGGAPSATQGRLRELSRRGMVAVALSQPGYGKSDGPPDFCGPRSQAALRVVIEHIRRQAFVDPSRIGIYGYSRGAIVTSVVATQVTDLAAIILGAGIYDLQDAYARLKTVPPENSELTGLRRNIELEAGTTQDAFLARSALPLAHRIKAPTLILHGANDDRSPPPGAQQLEAKLRATGTPVKLVMFPTAGHGIPIPERNLEIDPFLDRWLLRAKSEALAPR